MLNFVAGTALSIAVTFFDGADTVIPDVGTVTYTVYDNAGAAITGQTDQPVTTTAETTSISVAVPEPANTKALDFEYRTVVVKYSLGGQTRFSEVKYRLIDRIPMAVDAKSCRSLIGLAENELPDDDLDLPMAFYLVKDDLGGTDLTAALTAGTTVSYAANRAIVCKAILEAWPSIQLRTMQLEKSQTAQASRLTNIDLDKVENWVRGLYSKALLTVNGDTQGSLPLLGLATPTDPVTGS